MSAHSFKIIIPARYSSSRFEGKLLQKIAGVPILERSFRQAQKSNCDHLIIATDSEVIADLAKRLNVEVFFSKKKHNSGTERIAEVAKEKKWQGSEIIINLQADEPFINPSHINDLANFCVEKNSEMATLCSKAKVEQLSDNNIVKVVKNKNHQALYFSRAHIPNLRADFSTDLRMIKLRNQNIFRHIGIYAFRADFLQKLIHYPVSSLETIESLEQLRALYYAHQIDVLEVEVGEFDYGIDDINQLKLIEKSLKDNSKNYLKNE